eukprot:TRINITY_DN49841_c0_g1_i1.p1 TRINITY_DN49841_c0_g1~~TRINITY_DN49841_c0_g1_i1.p1  ORF type:complete len:394 (+),score=48.85 TRINITY_DN49841_c0_g1_i1:156-1337(+)
MSALVGFVNYELPDERELQAVRDMRSKLGVDSVRKQYSADVSGELRALRFLRGCGGNTELATELFQGMLEWRSTEKRFNIDDIHAAVVGMPLETFQQYFAAKPERPLLPSAVLGLSKSGSLVVHVKLGSWNFEKLSADFGASALVKHEIERLEWMMWMFHKVSEEEGRVPYLLMLVDVEGASLKQIPNKERKALIEVAKFLSARYLDAVEFVVVLNASWVFRLLWAALAPFLSKRQQAKLRIYGDPNVPATREVLHATITPEVLPVSLGGTARPDMWGVIGRQVTHSPSANLDATDSARVRSKPSFFSRARCLSCFPWRELAHATNDNDEPVQATARETAATAGASDDGVVVEARTTKKYGLVPVSVYVWILLFCVLIAAVLHCRVDSTFMFR